MKKINKTINLFTYDYPYEGNDNPFIEDEIQNISKIFNKVNVIPFKRGTEIRRTFFDTPNVYFNFELIKNIFLISNLFTIIRVIFSKNLWLELLKAKKPFFLKKIKMIIFEKAQSLILEKFIKENNFDLENDIFYSFWSNFTLLTFNNLRIKNSFSRTLGSDLNGFLINDDFVPFIKEKFSSLKLVLILNERQKEILLNGKFINSDKIIKSYLGAHPQNFCNISKNNKEEISFVSCGSLIEVKNPIKIADLIISFAKAFPKIKVKYTCIGEGKYQKKVESKFKNSSSNIEFNLIKKIPSFYDFIKKNNIDYLINLSSSEGMSFSNMEAMSCGVPVICNNISGNIELINNNNGIVYKEINDNSFEKLIISIYNNHTNIVLKNKKRESAYFTIKKNFNKKNLFESFSEIMSIYF